MTWRIWMLLVCGWAMGCGAVFGAAPLFRDFMGINGHTILFRPDLYRPTAGLVRDYHPVEWDLGTNSASVPPFPMARNGVSWREVYGSWRARGWRIDVSLMFETLPREQWQDLAADSFRYAEHFARVFGPSSAEAWVESAEIGNEPGKFSDADYRTVVEHMGRGFRAGDPHLRIVTGAMTTGPSHDYAKSVTCLEGLAEWYDVLNVHTYAELEGWPTWRRSYPEDFRLTNYLGDVRRLCAWRDQHAPGKEVWITEFGYDSATRPPDPTTEFKQWVGVTDTQQAQWNVRSWLIFAPLPVQRAYLFFFNDDDEARIHGASGLTRGLVPKPSFHAVAHLYQTLGAYRWSRVLVERPGEACLYEFIHGDDPSRRIWVAWSPTGRGREATLTVPPLPARVTRAEWMPLAAGSAPVWEAPARPTEVPLRESPLYLFLEAP